MASIAAVLVWIAYYHTLGIWHRLEATAEHLGTPRRMERLFQVRDGTVFCVISCNEAVVVVVYRTELARDESCGRLRSHVDEHVAKTRYESGELDGVSILCDFVADLPEVDSDASLFADHMTADVLRRCHSEPPGTEPVECFREWIDRVPTLRRGEALAIVTINSGID